MLAFVPPNHFNPRRVGVELEQQVLFLEASDVEIISKVDWLHDDRPVVGVVGRLPQQSAGFRNNGIHAVRLHQDELSLASGFDDHGRAVALFGGGACPPVFLTRVLIKRHRMGNISAGDADQPITVDEGMAGVAPGRGLGAVGLAEILRPEDLAVVDCQAEQVSLGSEHVDAFPVDQWSAPWAGRVGDRVGHRPGVLPELLAGGHIETVHSFRAGGT